MILTLFASVWQECHFWMVAKKTTWNWIVDCKNKNNSNNKNNIQRDAKYVRVKMQICIYTPWN